MTLLLTAFALAAAQVCGAQAMPVGLEHAFAHGTGGR